MAVFDVKLIRENPEEVRKMLEKRHSSFPLDELIKKDEEWRKKLYELQQLRHERNKVSEELANERNEDKINRMKQLKQEIKRLEEETASLEREVNSLLMKCPNMLHPDVPEGKDEKDNIEIRRWGEPVKKSFELKPHGELIEALGLGDFEKAAKVAGRGFNYLFSELALLDLALQRFALDFLINKGYRLVLPPYMLRRKAYEGIIDLDDFEKVMYKIEEEDLYLIPTSEHPLIALYADEVIPEEDLPVRMVGLSTAFRKEIGAHGVDTRGLFRMHQFNKVEQIIICKPEDSEKHFEEMHANIEEIYKKLGIPFRTVEICSGDLSIKNYRQYDIEAWFPRQGKYAEVGSTSNCTDFQSRGLNIKYGKRGGEKEYVHTLNATGLATSRAIVAILENYQNEDGTITVPEVLIPYMNGVKVIGKK